MRNKHKLFVGLAFLFFFIGTVSIQKDPRFVSFTTDASSIKLYWKDDSGHVFKSIQNLKTFVEGKNHELKFAMNGGMYMEDNTPLGLFIENGKTIRSLNTRSATGNFYLKPNGVFYITKDGKAIVCKTEDFIDNGQVNLATQSGPMLLIDGQMHPAFKQGSVNLNIRNGVGILPDNRVIFAMSRDGVNFYDFAEYFKNMGCKNALYLDGFVSRTYLPEENWKQLDGNFGVIIGVIK